MSTQQESAKATYAEVSSWFFEDYLPRWIGAAKGAEGPEFIHQYWSTPLHVNAAGQHYWCLDDASVLEFLEWNYAPLRAAGYSHTAVPDRRVLIYSPLGAAIEVIWSRLSTEGVEIQRLAVHLEVAKTNEGWRMVGVQGTFTDKDTLDEVWPSMSDVAGDT